MITKADKTISMLAIMNTLLIIVAFSWFVLALYQIAYETGMIAAKNTSADAANSIKDVVLIWAIIILSIKCAWLDIKKA